MTWSYLLLAAVTQMTPVRDPDLTPSCQATKARGTAPLRLGVRGSCPLVIQRWQEAVLCILCRLIDVHAKLRYTLHRDGETNHIKRVTK
jgi:hypothetical protein